VCAIIVSYRTGPALSACLAALIGAAPDEVIIVDNGNDAPEVQTLDAFAVAQPNARVLRGQGNVGFARACNLAALQANRDVLAFINPDVILEPDALARLTAALKAAPPPAIIGGDLRDRAGRPERGARRERLTLWRAFVSFSGLSRLEGVIPAFRDFNRERDPMPARPEPVSAVSGALMAMRRADFETLGGFDEGYFLHVEDVDLCRRAQDLGWRVLFAPGPHGVHLRSTSMAPPTVIARHKARSFARYFRKFARSPLERGLSALAAPLLYVLLPLRARR
jgi:N-acetylglucosaminyl-diphospho-decaprenol L-rhamnosyltransferase